MKRKLTTQEIDAIRQLVSQLPALMRNQILLDIGHSVVEEMGYHGSRLMFDIADYVRPPYHGQHDYGMQGTVNDSDGAPIDVSLYADENDRILEMEFLKWSDAPIIKIDWNSFAIRWF